MGAAGTPARRKEGGSKMRRMLVACASVLALAVPASAQVNSYSADAYAKPNYDGYAVPKNGYGQPDLSGVWSNATTTPVERRSEHKNLILT
jgi:hypothetical protein